MFPEHRSHRLVRLLGHEPVYTREHKILGMRSGKMLCGGDGTNLTFQDHRIPRTTPPFTGDFHTTETNRVG